MVRMQGRWKKAVWGVLAAGWVLLAAEAALAAPRIVTDMGGRKVTVPGEIRRVLITCYGGATHEVAVLGCADRIVGQPDMKRFPALVDLFPRFAGSPDAGSFDNVNVEEALKLKPHVVIASVTASKGNKQLEEAGLPVVQVLTGRADVPKLLQEFRMLGDLLGQEKRAARLVAYWERKLKLLADRTASIPQKDRKRVYYLLGDFLHTNGSAWWGEALIRTAGGINVASELGKVRAVNAEQLLAWNPDVILISCNTGSSATKQDLEHNPQLRNLRAVKEGNLHYCPIGAFWWDRPSPEAVLGFLWLAKTLYPERFLDLDLKKETRDFYAAFYGSAPTDARIEGFFDPLGQKGH